MTVIGFRCWKEKFSFVILAGSKGNPTLISRDVRKAPANAQEPEKLAWTAKEVREILDATGTTSGFYKREEAFSQKKNLDRARMEGVVVEATYSAKGGFAVPGLSKSSIKSKLANAVGVGVESVLEEVGLTECDKPDYREAALVALCALPD